MKGAYLGEFEEFAILNVVSIGAEAYAVLVKSDAESYAKQKVNISAIHSALYRLEEKGFLHSEFEAATNKRG